MLNQYSTLTNPQAVAANRAGLLTDEQRAQIERQGRGMGWLVLLILVPFGTALLVPTLLDSGVFSTDGVAAGSLVCGSPLLAIGIGLVALGVYAPIGTARLRRTLKGELAAGLVARGAGWVAYSPRGYVAHMEWTQSLPGSGALRWRRGRRVSLPPGRYHFYYLPQSGTLLSAEALEASAIPPEQVFSPPPAPPPDPLAGLPGYTPAPQWFDEARGARGVGATTPLSPVATGALQAALAEAHRFTMDDLAQNRQGRLSARQARRLSTWRWIPIAFALAFWSCAALVTLVSLSGRLLSAGIAVALMLGLIPAIAVWRAMRRGADLRDGRVEAVEGVVTARAESSGETRAYYYVVTGKKFQVPGVAYPALISGLRYRIFYTPKANRLVSIEPVGA